MNRLSVIIALLLVVLQACGDRATLNEGVPRVESETYGLNQAVLLTDASQEIVLADFFKDPASIDSMHYPKGLKGEWNQEQGLVMLSGNMTAWVDAIDVYIHGQSLSIPLKRAAKERVQLVFHAVQEAQRVDFVGDLNSWRAGAHPFEKQGEQWELNIELYPGGYPYRIEVDGVQQLDSNNPNKVPNGFGAFNSFLKVEQSHKEKIPRLVVTSANEGMVQVTSTVVGAQWFALWQNQVLEARKEEGVYGIPVAATEVKRSYIRIWAYTPEGLANEIRIPLEHGKVVSSTDQLTREDKEAYIMYFMMVDRFVNGDSSNDEPVQDARILPRANYYGGDLEGVRQKLEEGYFDELGVNTIWISPIGQNPKGAYQEYPEPRRWFSGYHGYWPVRFKKVDHRFGDGGLLHRLVDESHAKNYNVILDYVCNHVHEEHPMIQAHPEWRTQLDLPDGRRNLRLWDEYRLTTWFDDFLPSLDFTIPEVNQVVSDSALWWIETYDLDGFRHDATKHIPESFWRIATLKLKALGAERNRSYFQVGETFGSRELIQSYIGSGMMDGQFDFNLYFDAVNAFKDTVSPMSKLAESLEATLLFHGDLHLMCNITGNHDLTRFISLASKAVRDDEDQKEAGWKRVIKVEDPVGYDKLKMLETFIMTIPGIPVIFYGDEIGMPGANDPDNRRMMRFDDLTENELAVKAHVAAITKLRASHLAFMYGNLEVLHADDQTMVFRRSYLGDQAIVMFNNSDRTREITLPAASLGLTALRGDIKPMEKGEAASISMPPFSTQILYTP
jgi:cyclomaltodextrinase